MNVRFSSLYTYLKPITHEVAVGKDHNNTPHVYETLSTSDPNWEVELLCSDPEQYPGIDGRMKAALDADPEIRSLDIIEGGGTDSPVMQAAAKAFQFHFVFGGKGVLGGLEQAFQNAQEAARHAAEAASQKQ